MSNAARISRIVVAPTPADTGTTLTVMQDEGDRFAPVSTPFTALVWPSQTVPRLGVDSERVTVVRVDGDTFTITRGSPSIAITSGLMIAVVQDETIHEHESSVTFRAVFPAPGSAYAIEFEDPEGRLIDVVAMDEGGGTASYLFTGLAPGGHWRYRWSADGVRVPEQTFYVKF